MLMIIPDSTPLRPLAGIELCCYTNLDLTTKLGNGLSDRNSSRHEDDSGLPCVQVNLALEYDAGADKRARQ